MKQIVAQLLDQALQTLPELSAAAGDLAAFDTVERTRDTSHGDFASNIAMRLAKPARMKPRDIATALVDAIAASEKIRKIDIAGPGFINFHLGDGAFHDEVRQIVEQGAQYGRQSARAAPKILLEFVSANPTGPLHVGHGRLAAYGATVGNLLEAAGFTVHREYYVNDAGRQMDILGASVWVRWLQQNGVEVPFPAGGYRGDYIRDIAANIDTAALTVPQADDINSELPADAPDGDKDAYVDALIASAIRLQGEDGFGRIRQQALESIRDDIRGDLEDFGVRFDNWYSEQSLTRTGRIDDALAVLRKRDLLYEKDGATWFPATRFGDEKDRVVVRANGLKTYFASDIAYHFDKRERGFDHLIDVLGADHHGYFTRVQAGLEAMGYQGDDLEVILLQFVSLYRGGKKMQMSTRSGEFDTLRQLRAEVGNDAARFYYVMRSSDQHLDFDLDVATSQSNDNPVYYIQYAHARVAGVFTRLAEQSRNWNRDHGLTTLAALTTAQEKALMTSVSRYPEILELAAGNRAPQTLVHYLRDLAADFHSWYNAHKFIDDPDDIRDARLTLCAATRIVIANGLQILGVSAPESM